MAKKKPPAPKLTQVHILSDSTGNLARHMLTAVLTQFPPHSFTLQFHPFLANDDRVAQALHDIKRKPGLIMHAFLDESAKKMANDFGHKHELPVLDLTNHLVHFIEKHSGLTSARDHTALHPVDEFYLKRIRAMEFALAHDDGLGLDTIHKAQCVLAGVSRTSKTPTTIFLAQQGLLVGNVSLAMGIEPPAELLKLPPSTVVGLIISPHKLAEIRTRRNHSWQLGDTAYNDLDMIQEELAWSRRLFNRNNWPILDVTDYAIEETAARVIEVLGINHPRER